MGYHPMGTIHIGKVYTGIAFSRLLNVRTQLAEAILADDGEFEDASSILLVTHVLDDSPAAELEIRIMRGSSL